MLHLFSKGLLIVGLFFLQVSLIEVLKNIRFVLIVVFLRRVFVVFLHAVDVVDEDYFIETIFLLLSKSVFQVFCKGSEGCSFFCLLEHLGLLVFLVFLERDSIALHELRMNVLQVIHLAVDHFFILL